ncbi:MAG: hypothetical protein BroJett004_08120 [Planctomycetota bacterium]|nr:MAG: hypothetical protein BroJett004_08120 [Planctomycetota bacterium]
MAPNAQDDPRLPRGWTRQQMTLPTALATEFRGASEAAGYGAGKLLGTAAVAVFLGLPDHARIALVDWVMTTSWKAPQAVRPEEAWKVVVNALREPDGRWYLDRVLDPEVTPRPGEKASEKAARKGRREVG